MKPWLILLLAGTALISPAAAEPVSEDASFTAAVALYKPGLETPIETAGTGLSPEVTVEVTVDTRGVVSDVQVLEIDPSSEFDDYFRQVTRDTVMSWRYAPALSGDVPVETVMKWSVQFPARVASREPQTGGGRHAISWKFGSPGKGDAEAMRRQILALPMKQRLAMLQQEAKRAVSYMDQSIRKRVETNRFIVFSDAESEEVAQVIGNNLEALFLTLEEMFAGSIDPQPERYKIVVVLFEHLNTFEAYKRSIRRMEWASGFYFPAGMIAMYREMPTSESLLSTLLHEGTHAFLDRHIVSPGRRFPRWIDEGFAEYIGNSRVQKKRLVPGKTQRSQIYRTPFGLMMGESEQTMSVDSLRAAVKKREALTVSDLIGADLATFYGEKRNQYYPMSWLLIHFLHHGLEDQGAEEFSDFLLYVAEGYPEKEAFKSVYGVAPESLNARFHEHIRKF